MNNYTTINIDIAGREFAIEAEWRKQRGSDIGSDAVIIDGIVIESIIAVGCDDKIPNQDDDDCGILIGLIGDIIVEKIKAEGMK